MEKISVVFALFAALILVVSCGGSEDPGQIVDSDQTVDGCGGQEDSGQTVDGRMWSSRSSSTYNWSDAFSYCDNLTEGGYSDWRLPNINELRTLIKNCAGSQAGGSCAVQDPDCLSSSCCVDNNCSCYYMENNCGYYSKLGDPDGVELWSSSASDRDGGRRAWRVRFGYGDVKDNYKSSHRNVRCVR